MKGSGANVSASFQRKKSIFVAWTQVSRRSAELAKNFNAEYYRLERVDYPLYYVLFKLFINSVRTFFKLLRIRPSIIFTFQAHPFVTCVATFYKVFTGAKVVPDLHTAAYTNYDRFPINILNFFLWQNSDIVLVHNQCSYEFLCERYKSLKQKLFVLEDPLPEFSRFDEYLTSQWEKPMLTCVLVSRFSADEPIVSFLEAVREIKGVHFYITGDYKKANFSIEKYLSDNITLTGFLSDEHYISLLHSVDFVVALTRRELTLLSGGYEALSMEKPLVVSNTVALRKYYRNSVVYTSNNSNDIAKAINEITTNLSKYRKLSAQLKRKKRKEWQEKQKELIRRLIES